MCSSDFHFQITPMLPLKVTQPALKQKSPTTLSTFCLYIYTHTNSIASRLLENHERCYSTTPPTTTPKSRTAKKTKLTRSQQLHEHSSLHTSSPNISKRCNTKKIKKISPSPQSCLIPHCLLSELITFPLPLYFFDISAISPSSQSTLRSVNSDTRSCAERSQPKATATNKTDRRRAASERASPRAPRTSVIDRPPCTRRVGWEDSGARGGGGTLRLACDRGAREEINKRQRRTGAGGFAPHLRVRLRAPCLWRVNPSRFTALAD